ncbi:hypothetical protein [Gracilibacillus boraciitolerans]|uniref:hypothetical protein n=1 Tax=Gracilibacillus boraciitolerans TaxID=307521 RepID=UPI0011DC97D6|nr:hypothetical protein [Gracilibacillus boraciitolerans]
MKFILGVTTAATCPLRFPGGSMSIYSLVCLVKSGGLDGKINKAITSKNGGTFFEGKRNYYRRRKR